jgi:hypothetical protein
MATIRKRGDKWHVQVRRNGCPTSTRTFIQRTDAQRWANQTEIEADRRGLTNDRKVLEQLKVATGIELILLRANARGALSRLFSALRAENNTKPARAPGT